VIWVKSEPEYFCKEGWTGEQLICPPGNRQIVRLTERHHLVRRIASQSSLRTRCEVNQTSASSRSRPNSISGCRYFPIMMIIKKMAVAPSQQRRPIRPRQGRCGLPPRQKLNVSAGPRGQLAECYPSGNGTNGHARSFVAFSRSLCAIGRSPPRGRQLVQTWVTLQPLGSAWSDPVARESLTSPPPMKREAAN
jgi:hypothetical protein